MYIVSGRKAPSRIMDGKSRLAIISGVKRALWHQANTFALAYTREGTALPLPPKGFFPSLPANREGTKLQYP